MGERGSRPTWVRAAVVVAAAVAALAGRASAVVWEWDGVRYIQHTNPHVDGEYWSNYQPDPPEDYQFETFFSHSADSFNQEGRFICTIAMQGQYQCDSVGEAVQVRLAWSLGS
jgi:hypothetical protein